MSPHSSRNPAASIINQKYDITLSDNAEDLA
jgi:hypothetical protein